MDYTKTTVVNGDVLGLLVEKEAPELPIYLMRFNYRGINVLDFVVDLNASRNLVVVVDALPHHTPNLVISRHIDDTKTNSRYNPVRNYIIDTYETT